MFELMLLACLLIIGFSPLLPEAPDRHSSAGRRNRRFVPHPPRRHGETCHRRRVGIRLATHTRCGAMATRPARSAKVLPSGRQLW
ncbi:hypothetical protein EDC39_10177 [Geothermobacter ehrlichii]|uniref:Uncharacterized protein n=1 Tax=Geothermobacter ehrlichii TaxID=213224 RepID=A0A5D3WMX4_9BACT|nr:hypothetical protein [Geothermobacter ehrlichii]TYO99917.1 hypothetical protein EDC39_10177 [Geothermobacter ehrlichii]